MLSNQREGKQCVGILLALNYLIDNLKKNHIMGVGVGPWPTYHISTAPLVVKLLSLYT